MDDLTDLQKAFVREYLIDLNATKAYIRAGYKSKGKGAESNSCRVMGVDKVKAAIEAALAKRAKKLEINAAWVLKQLVKNVRRASQAVPVLDNKGKETGEYRYDGNVVNRALELIGKHVGPDMFPDTINVKDTTDGTLARAIEERAASLRTREARIRDLLARTGASANGHAPAAAPLPDDNGPAPG